MVKWDGYGRNQKAPFDLMKEDAEGAPLGLTLLPFANGERPTLQVQAQLADDVDDDDDAVDDDAVDADDDEGGGEEDVPPPPLSSVEAHGQIWEKKESEHVKADRRMEPRWKPSLNAGGVDLNDIEALFNFLLPPEYVELIMTYTNPLLDEHDAVHAKLTKGEVLRFFGYMISLSVHSGIPLDKMWSTTAPTKSTASAPAMGRFGISRNRFNKIRSVFRCGPSDDVSFAQNEWCFVEPVLDAFNDHTFKQVIAGWLLAEDETMSAWRGKQGKKDTKKIPKLMFVKRKPEPLGAEFKDIADAQSKILLRAEITKGKAEVVKPKYFSKENGATAATTMRLAEPWFGTRRVVAGDSWFASVRTAEMLEKNGLYFIGDVKTGTKRFVPKDIYNAGTADENGAWSTWVSSLELGGDETIPIFCVTHRRGESIHAFVATCGTTLPGTACMAYFEDDEERVNAEVTDYEITRKCPRVLNDFTLAQPAIDCHNRYRQHILAMEKRLITNNYSFRFFTTMLGFVAVNAFFALRYFKNPLADFKVEMDRLALALMNNPHAEAPTNKKSQSNKRAPASPADSDGCTHTLVPLRSLRFIEWRTGKQMKCILCNADTTWVCSECTTGPDELVPICPEVTIARKDGPRYSKGDRIEHPCLGRHRCNPSFFPQSCKKSKTCKRARAARAEEDGD